MSIASEKIKLATERFLLVRINPSRYILPVLNAGLYEITLPFTVNNLQRNGVDLTKVSGTPAVNDEWSQNESTGLLRVKLAGAPNDTTNVLTAYYYLFYTGTIFRSISEDPENSLTPIREWQPRIKTYPSIVQSIDNIFYGVFSLSDVQIELINENRNFQPFLTDDDSFSNKTVDIWLCITNVSNIKKIFTGTIKTLSFNQNSVFLNCVDFFQNLKAPALMGDSNNEAYFNLDTYPQLDPKFKDQPIPYIVGPFSRFESYGDFETTSGLKVIHKISDGNKAKNYNFTPSVSTTTNREYIACRQKDVIATQNFGSVLGIVEPGGNKYFFVNFSVFQNITLGDNIKYNDGVDQYGLIVYVDNFTYLGNPYNCVVYAPNGTFTGSTIINMKSFGMAIKDNNTGTMFHPIYERDYSIDDSQITQGGNRLIKITFGNNFESTLSMPTLNPNIHEVFYRTSNASPETHADIIEDICETVGLTVDPTSFAQAYTDLSVNALFSIPNTEEGDYDLYLKYVQDVLGSTLGFLRLNEDQEVEYFLLKPPTSTDVRDSFLMLNEQSGCELNYQDILTTIIGYNPHNSSEHETIKSPSPSETRENNRAKYLHNIDNVTRFKHCLQTITDRIDSQLGFKSSRFVKYMFKTATQDIDSVIGQDIEIQNKIVLGSGQTQDVKIITIEKSPSLVSIEASDLKGI